MGLSLPTGSLLGYGAKTIARLATPILKLNIDRALVIHQALQSEHDHPSHLTKNGLVEFSPSHLACGLALCFQFALGKRLYESYDLAGVEPDPFAARALIYVNSARYDLLERGEFFTSATDPLLWCVFDLCSKGRGWEQELHL